VSVANDNLSLRAASVDRRADDGGGGGGGGDGDDGDGQ